MLLWLMEFMPFAVALCNNELGSNASDLTANEY